MQGIAPLTFDIDDIRSNDGFVSNLSEAAETTGDDSGVVDQASHARVAPGRVDLGVGPAAVARNCDDGTGGGATFRAGVGGGGVRQALGPPPGPIGGGGDG